MNDLTTLELLQGEEDLNDFISLLKELAEEVHDELDYIQDCVETTAIQDQIDRLLVKWFPGQKLESFELEEQGGCWNDGGEISVVVKFRGGYWKKEGSYSSWGCNYWNKFYRVEPVKVEAVEWLKV